MMMKPEIEEERRNRNLNELEGKNIAYYSTMLSLYINSRLDANKTILTLSTAAIGLLLTYSSPLFQSNCIILFTFVFSIISFAIAALSTLFVFNANTKAIESYIREEKEAERDLKLKSYKKINYLSFAFGICLTALVAVLKIFIKAQ